MREASITQTDAVLAKSSGLFRGKASRIVHLLTSRDRLGDYGMHILESARMCGEWSRVLRYDFLAEAMGFAILKPRHDKRRH